MSLQFADLLPLNHPALCTNSCIQLNVNNSFQDYSNNSNNNNNVIHLINLAPLHSDTNQTVPAATSTRTRLLPVPEYLFRLNDDIIKSGVSYSIDNDNNNNNLNSDKLITRRQQQQQHQQNGIARLEIKESRVNNNNNNHHHHFPISDNDHDNNNNNRNNMINVRSPPRGFSLSTHYREMKWSRRRRKKRDNNIENITTQQLHPSTSTNMTTGHHNNQSSSNDRTKKSFMLTDRTAAIQSPVSQSANRSIILIGNGQNKNDDDDEQTHNTESMSIVTATTALTDSNDTMLVSSSNLPPPNDTITEQRQLTTSSTTAIAAAAAATTTTSTVHNNNDQSGEPQQETTAGGFSESMDIISSDEILTGGSIAIEKPPSINSRIDSLLMSVGLGTEMEARNASATTHNDSTTNAHVSSSSSSPTTATTTTTTSNNIIAIHPRMIIRLMGMSMLAAMLMTIFTCFVCKRYLKCKSSTCCCCFRRVFYSSCSSSFSLSDHHHDHRHHQHPSTTNLAYHRGDDDQDQHPFNGLYRTGAGGRRRDPYAICPYQLIFNSRNSQRPPPLYSTSNGNQITANHVTGIDEQLLMADCQTDQLHLQHQQQQSHQMPDMSQEATNLYVLNGGQNDNLTLSQGLAAIENQRQQQQQQQLCCSAGGNHHYNQPQQLTDGRHSFGSSASTTTTTTTTIATATAAAPLAPEAASVDANNRHNTGGYNVITEDLELNHLYSPIQSITSYHHNHNQPASSLSSAEANGYSPCQPDNGGNYAGHCQQHHHLQTGCNRHTSSNDAAPAASSPWAASLSILSSSSATLTKARLLSAEDLMNLAKLTEIPIIIAASDEPPEVILSKFNQLKLLKPHQQQSTLQAISAPPATTTTTTLASSTPRAVLEEPRFCLLAPSQVRSLSSLAPIVAPTSASILEVATALKSPQVGTATGNGADAASCLEHQLMATSSERPSATVQQMTVSSSQRSIVQAINCAMQHEPYTSHNQQHHLIRVGPIMEPPPPYSNFITNTCPTSCISTNTQPTSAATVSTITNSSSSSSSINNNNNNNSNNIKSPTCDQTNQIASSGDSRRSSSSSNLLPATISLDNCTPGAQQTTIVTTDTDTDTGLETGQGESSVDTTSANLSGGGPIIIASSSDSSGDEIMSDTGGGNECRSDFTSSSNNDYFGSTSTRQIR